MNDLRAGDWVLIRHRSPVEWLKVASVSPTEVVVHDHLGLVTVPRRDIYATAEAATLDNPAPPPPTK